MAIRNTYGPGSALSSSMDLRGVDIGPKPDFYGDLDEMIRRLRPLPVAGQQAQALRAPAPSERAVERTPTRIASEPPDYSAVTPRSLGRFQMNNQGGWGTFVDPADIPAGLQDQIMGGFYGQMSNWDSSNPQIMGPQQWRTGKYGGR